MTAKISLSSFQKLTPSASEHSWCGFCRVAFICGGYSRRYKIIGASAFSDTGIKYLVVPGSIEKIKSGALNSDTTVEIVLNGDHDSEKLNEIFNEAGMLAKTGSTVKTAVGTYTVSVNEETAETSLVNSKAGKVIQSNLNPVNVNNFLNRIINLNELEPVLILDKNWVLKSLCGLSKPCYLGERLYWKESRYANNKKSLFNNTYPLFESYFQAVNALYEALANEELVLLIKQRPIFRMISGIYYSNMKMK